MAYFVTGATGFIGRRLVIELSTRGVPIWVLARRSSREKFVQLQRDCGAAAGLLTAVWGDLGEPLLGVGSEALAQLRGRIEHFFHLGALYDLRAVDADLATANVQGTRHALDAAEALQAGRFHLVSSIAAAGRYRGTFTENMFAEAGALDLPYFRTKHESEALVRADCRRPWRIYRPGMVVGDSRTGVIDKIDGPYYLFRAIQKLRDVVPRAVPLPGIEGGHVNLVPVDFVAAALVHLAHVPDQDGRCFHLTDPTDRRFGETLNIFAKAAHAPTMAMRLNMHVGKGLSALAGPAPQLLESARHVVAQLLDDLGVPQSLADLLDYPTRFDCSRAQALLEPAGIRVPPLESYAWRLWDYWERQLDPLAHPERALAAMLRGKTVLITGGSSGIGRATALRLADAGANLLLVARDAARLEAVRKEIEARGGRVTTYRCDLSDPPACDALIAQLLADHGRVDVLINNAARSIRRGIDQTFARLHDYERLMRLNYFAAVRLTLGLLPAMLSQREGRVINVSSIGVLTNAPRFAGYNASKAALEAFSRCAAAEFAARGVRFSIVNLPLVRTPMVAPTKMYEHLDLMQPDQAAERICEAILDGPVRLSTPLGAFAQLVELFAPALGRAVMSEGFRVFPESGAASAPGANEKSAAGISQLAAIARGIHW